MNATNEMTNSHILVNGFDYAEPTTLDEALAVLAEHGDAASVLAGGTDLLVQMKMERRAPGVVVSLRRVAGLDAITWDENGLRIGALATIAAVRRHPVVQAHYPALAEACASFSTTQVQMMGTLGGNLCNGSPASDSAPALIAYEAQVALRSAAGERMLPVEDFFRGPGKTALSRGEMMVAVWLPEPLPQPSPYEGEGARFLKISRVSADIAKASAAVWLARDGDCVTGCRLAFGSVAPTPMRSRRAETLLLGQPFTPALAAEAGRIAAEEMTPIDDVRSTAQYRRQIVAVMVYDGLMAAWERSRVACENDSHSWATRRLDIIDVDTTGHPAYVGRGAEAEIVLTVNGTRRMVRVRPNDLLLNVLRDGLELTGSKYGCGIGECNACTVLLDGKPALACLVLAVSADGCRVETVEGLQAADGTLDPLQTSFLEHAAFQCGFCTPGMLMTAKALLRENPFPDEDQVRDYLKGNLCRCTGYASIVRAVMGAKGDKAG
jgi:xanthine dehydrogenase iron-sulfur cluster and FAD-binding subunit A